VDDRLLRDLYKACLLENPNMTKKEFERWALKNYHRPTKPRSIIRHLDRLLAQEKRERFRKAFETPLPARRSRLRKPKEQ
jgi:hypothetical protein